MKLALIVMTICIVMAGLMDLYNLYDIDKRLKRLETELIKLKTEAKKWKTN